MMSRLKLLQNNLTDDMRLSKEEDDSTKYSVNVTRNPPLGPKSTANLKPPSKLLLSFDGITTMVSREVFHFVVEQCQPLGVPNSRSNSYYAVLHNCCYAS